MNQKKRVIHNTVQLYILFLITLVMNRLDSTGIFFLHGISSMFFLILSFFLLIYFRNRIIDGPLRRILSAMGALIIVWAILRTCKYIVFKDLDTAARYCWYMYYIPMLSIPQLYFHAALRVGNPLEKKPPSIHILTGAVTVIFMILVITNDMHEKVFNFHPGFENWDYDHSYGKLYWVITAWHYLFIIISLVILFWKCRCTASRNLIWVPMIFAASLAFLLIIEVNHFQIRYLGYKIFSFTETAGFLLSGFWILMISIGLVPSNKGYEKLLVNSEVSAQFANADGNVVYRSSSAFQIPKEQLTDSGPVMSDENTVIHRMNVSGGYAYWQVDVSDINKLNRELADAGEALSEESEIIRMENMLKQRLAEIEQKNAVYDLIAERVLPQSRKIQRLSEDAAEHPEKFDVNMRLTCVYAAYIKRLSNIMLLNSENKTMERKELQMALHESARKLNDAGIITSVDFDDGEYQFRTEELADAYEKFETLLESSLPDLKALSIISLGETLRLVFEGVELQNSDDDFTDIETEEGISFVTIQMRRGGETL